MCDRSEIRVRSPIGCIYHKIIEEIDGHSMLNSLFRLFVVISSMCQVNMASIKIWVIASTAVLPTYKRDRETERERDVKHKNDEKCLTISAFTNNIARRLNNLNQTAKKNEIFICIFDFSMQQYHLFRLKAHTVRDRYKPNHTRAAMKNHSLICIH